MTKMKIDRCICFQKPFSLLKSVAKEENCDSVEALQEHIVFGQNCQLCKPYVRKMLDTGEVEFSEVITSVEAGT